MELIQGTTAWHEYRRQGIGSSDAPVIMQVSPWKTPYVLWEEKTGRSDGNRAENQFIKDKGHRLEARARAHYELARDIPMAPANVEHADYPWLRASLDGFNKEADRVLEIKFAGKEDHEKATNQIIPEKYFPQVQHQLLVTGVSKLDYLSISDDEHVAIVEVSPDLEYLLKYFEQATEFWNLVREDKAPDFCDRDFKKIPQGLSKEVFNYIRLKRALDALEDEVAEAKKMLLQELPEHPRFRGHGIQITSFSRKGAIDYAKVPALHGVDLEPFRKKPSVVTAITEVK